MKVYRIIWHSDVVDFYETLAEAKRAARVGADRVRMTVEVDEVFVRQDIGGRELAVKMLNDAGWIEREQVVFTARPKDPADMEPA